MEYKKYIPCRVCKEKAGPQKGFYYAEANGKTILVECSCHKKWARENEIIRKFNESGIDEEHYFSEYVGTDSYKSFLDLKLVSENPEVFRKKRLIYVEGAQNVVQKENMCMALGFELIKKGFSVRYISMFDVIDNLIKDYSIDKEEKLERSKVIEDCLTCDFLFLYDSFSRDSVNLSSKSYQVPYLDRFFKDRLDKNKKTMFILSETPINQLSALGYGVNMQNFVESKSKGTVLQFKDRFDINRNIGSFFDSARNGEI